MNDSKVDLVCFISYIGSGIAWSYSIFNPLWSVFGWVSMGVSQLVWGIVLLRNQKNFPYPQVCNKTALIFIHSAFLSILYWSIFGRLSVLALFVGFGWLFAIGAVITGVLLVKFSRVINEPSSTVTQS
jgi:hypothetical protein